MQAQHFHMGTECGQCNTAKPTASEAACLPVCQLYCICHALNYVQVLHLQAGRQPHCLHCEQMQSTQLTALHELGQADCLRSEGTHTAQLASAHP